MTCQICGCDELRMHHTMPVMLMALRECISRLRYDGDHHHDLGLDSRRDASWEAMRLAQSALALATGDFESIGEPVRCRPLIRSGEGEPESDPGLLAGSPMQGVPTERAPNVEPLPNSNNAIDPNDPNR